MNDFDIYHEYNNPYSNNPLAKEKSRSKEMYEGRLYTKISYELMLNQTTRLLKIIYAVALAIITCCISLAFEKAREIWLKGIRGVENITILISKGPFQGIAEFKDIENLIMSRMAPKDLFVMRSTSTHNRVLAELALIKQLNDGEIELKDLKIKSFSNIKDFFGENCSKIIRLDLTNFPHIKNVEIKIISEIFTKLNCLSLDWGSLRYSFQNEVEINHLQHCKELRSFSLTNCSNLKILSVLQHFKELRNLNLKNCFKHQLNSTDLNFLQCCKELRSLNLKNCHGVRDLNFLQYFKELESLNLKNCYRVSDLRLLQYCKEIKSLNLKNCHRVRSLNFSQYYPKLENLNIEGCRISKKEIQVLRGKGIIGPPPSRVIIGPMYTVTSTSTDWERCKRVDRFNLENYFNRFHPFLDL